MFQLSYYAETPQQPTVAGNSLYFIGRFGAVGIRLYKTDGTAAGTTIVKEVTTSNDPNLPVSAARLGIDNLTLVGSTLFFTIDLPNVGQQLWKTDGTAAGTTMVLSLVGLFTPPAGSPPGIWDNVPIRQATAAAGKLFFVATDNDRGEELWVSDGAQRRVRRPHGRCDRSVSSALRFQASGGVHR